MATFLNNLVSAHAAIVFVLLLICLNYGYPGFRERVAGNFWWLLWFLAAVICLIAWIKIVFGV